MTDENDNGKPPDDAGKPPTDPPKVESKTPADTGSSTTDDEKKSVREIIREELQAMGASRDTITPRRQNIEAEADRLVKEASARLIAEQEHQQEHQTLKQIKENAKELVEETPRKVRRLTKALWGEDK